MDRGLGGLGNWTIFMDVVCLSSLLFLIQIEIIKAKENHINISHEKYKYIDSCLEISDG